MVVTIIGLGLIGGSLGLSLKQNGFASKIIGVDNNPSHAKEALALEIVDEIMRLDEAIDASRLVLLAIPVNTAKKLLPSILDLAKPETVVVDMGSTKVGICEAARNHKNRQCFVASHPISGTENSGPSAAFATLFMQKVSIICEMELSGKYALGLAERLYKSMYMKLIYMNPEEHDRHIAYVSHLSHITSFALGLTVLEVEKDEKTIFNMAGSGFASTARLAKSSPQMWAPIFEQNSKNLSTVLEAYIDNLKLFKKHIDNGDSEEIHKLMAGANRIRKILD